MKVCTQDFLDLLGLTLRGQSLGGIRTCLELPGWDLLVDLGSVDHRQVGASTVLITHGHLDHLGGLPSHIALRELMGLDPAQYVIPEAIEGPIKELLATWRKLDGAELNARFVPLAPGSELEFRKGLRVIPFATNHRVVSQGYRIHSTKSVLKPKFQGQSSQEIATRKRDGETVTDTVDVTEIAFSGDTRIEGMLADPTVLSARRLVMECTFMDDRVPLATSRKHGHIHLDEVAEHADAFACEVLVLTHRSMRHSPEAAADLVRAKLPDDLLERVVLF